MLYETDAAGFARRYPKTPPQDTQGRWPPACVYLWVTQNRNRAERDLDGLDVRARLAEREFSHLSDALADPTGDPEEDARFPSTALAIALDVKGPPIDGDF